MILLIKQNRSFNLSEPFQTSEKPQTLVMEMTKTSGPANLIKKGLDSNNFLEFPVSMDRL